MEDSWDKYYLGQLEYIASKSKDPSTKVGCIIVGPDNEVRSQGFNGFPRKVKDRITPSGLINYCGILIKIDEIGQRLERQECENLKKERYSRPAKYFFTEHAERNAIYNAARCGIPLKNCKLYVPWHPCHDCARGIIQSGIIEVILNKSFDDSELAERWKESWGYAKTMFKEAGVEVRKV